MSNTQTAQAFYDHKREAHKGDYERNCPECAAKWDALLTDSKTKATGRGES